MFDNKATAVLRIDKIPIIDKIDIIDKISIIDYKVSFIEQLSVPRYQRTERTRYDELYILFNNSNLFFTNICPIFQTMNLIFILSV